MPTVVPAATDATTQTTDIFEQVIGNVYIATIVKVAVAVGVVIFFIMISKVIASVVKRKILQYSEHMENKQYGEQMANLMKDIVFYTLLIFSLFIGFEVLGFDVALILGGISFGVGLAFKEVLGNMIAGIMLLSIKEVKLGDIISMSVDGVEYFGKIEEIGIRTTTIRTFDMKQVVLPNIKLIESPIQTFSREEMIRLDLMIEVHYNSDLEHVVQVFTTAVNSCPFIKDIQKTMIIVESFGASGIGIRCFFFVDPNCGWSIPQMLGYAHHIIANYAKANNIVIPYPHTTIQADTSRKELIQSMHMTA